MMVSDKMKAKAAEMKRVMDYMIEQMLEEGMTDMEILAMTKLMQEKARELEDKHVDEIVGMSGDHAVGIIMEGTEIFSELSEVFGV